MPRHKIDPLLAALIKKLPAGNEWPVDRQLAWLNMTAMAFGSIYGGDAAQRLGIKPEKIEPPKFEPVKRRHPFIIDEKGYVKRGTGERIMPKDVAGEIFDMRGFDSDLRAIIWADDSTGLNGQDLMIVS